MRLEIDSSSSAFPLENHEFGDDAFTMSSYDFGSLLKKGIAAAQSGERDQARKLLSQATAINPASEDAWMWLASISDYPEELLAFLNRVLEINPANAKAAEWRAATNSLLAKTFVQRALGARSDGRAEHAMQCLDQALACDNRCESAWYWKASLADDEEEKLELFEHVLTINPDNTEAADAIAHIREAQVAARLDEARRSLVSDPERAVEILSNLTEHEAEDVRESAWMMMAEAADNDDRRLECYGRVLAVNPYNKQAIDATSAITNARSKAVLEGARAAAARGNRGEALSIIEDYVQTAPANADAWLLKSHLSESLDEKVEALEKALEIDPQNAAARSGLEFLSLTFGSSTEAAASPAEGVEAPTVEESERADIEPVAAMEAAEVDPIVEFATRPTEESIRFDESTSFDVQTSDDEDMSAVRMDEAAVNEVEVDYAEVADDCYVMSVDESEAETVIGRGGDPTAELNVDSFGLNAEADPFTPGTPVSPFDRKADEDQDANDYEEVFAASARGCAFCGAANETQALECRSCRAILTLSDVERLLAPTNADREVLQHAVTSMEAEWNFREFTEEELTWLGLGHLNLGNLDNGLRYLQEASRLNPNNVILAGQANMLAIRIDEIKRQNESYDSMPKGKTILVVDDSATVRKLIAGKLEKSGHNVVCAVDGVEALARIDEQMPDLVLLDITMPRMDGYEVCKQIRANPLGKDLPVVMISGKDGFFDKVRGRMAGTTGYVTKPFGPETLMKALETYLVPDAVEVA